LSNFEFIPTVDQKENSNIFKFMKLRGISTLDELTEKANKNLEWFWKEVEQSVGIVWDKPYKKVLDSSKGVSFPTWFVGGKTNIYKSSVEKFSKTNPNKIAYTFISEDGKTSQITYLELDKKVSKLANSLKSLGVKKGDVIAIYLPMIEESILAILASAKIGAVQTVIFSGYSSESLQIRLQDCKAKILFVCDGFQKEKEKESLKKK
jgi:acetyl-CoA synthetase